MKKRLSFLFLLLLVVARSQAVLCYWCSGVGEDRICEKDPESVSTGPVFINCRSKFCITTKVFDIESGRVHSFARLCDDIPRGNQCVRDSRLLTCYESCTSDFCNHGNPGPHYLETLNYLASPTQERIKNETGRSAQNLLKKTVGANWTHDIVSSEEKSTDVRGSVGSPNKSVSATSNLSLSPSLYTLIGKDGVRYGELKHQLSDRLRKSEQHFNGGDPEETDFPWTDRAWKDARSVWSEAFLNPMIMKPSDETVTDLRDSARQRDQVKLVMDRHPSHYTGMPDSNGAGSEVSRFDAATQLPVAVRSQSEMLPQLPHHYQMPKHAHPFFSEVSDRLSSETAVERSQLSSASHYEVKGEGTSENVMENQMISSHVDSYDAAYVETGYERDSIEDIVSTFMEQFVNERDSAGPADNYYDTEIPQSTDTQNNGNATNTTNVTSATGITNVRNVKNATNTTKVTYTRNVTDTTNATSVNGTRNVTSVTGTRNMSKSSTTSFSTVDGSGVGKILLKFGAERQPTQGENGFLEYKQNTTKNLIESAIDKSSPLDSFRMPKNSQSGRASVSRITKAVTHANHNMGIQLRHTTDVTATTASKKDHTETSDQRSISPFPGTPQSNVSGLSPTSTDMTTGTVTNGIFVWFNTLTSSSKSAPAKKITTVTPPVFNVSSGNVFEVSKSVGGKGMIDQELQNPIPTAPSKIEETEDLSVTLSPNGRKLGGHENDKSLDNAQKNISYGYTIRRKVGLTETALDTSTMHTMEFHKYTDTIKVIPLASTGKLFISNSKSSAVPQWTEMTRHATPTRQTEWGGSIIARLNSERFEPTTPQAEWGGSIIDRLSSEHFEPTTPQDELGGSIIDRLSSERIELTTPQTETRPLNLQTLFTIKRLKTFIPLSQMTSANQTALKPQPLAANELTAQSDTPSPNPIQTSVSNSGASFAPSTNPIAISTTPDKFVQTVTSSLNVKPHEAMHSHSQVTGASFAGHMVDRWGHFHTVTNITLLRRNTSTGSRSSGKLCTLITGVVGFILLV